MFRRILIALILCSLAIGVYNLKQQIGRLPTVQRQTSLSALYKDVSPAVVWIGAEGDDNYYSYGGYDPSIGNSGKLKWQGTGFLISENGLIATAGHVVKDTQSFEVMFQDGTKTKADFVYSEDLGICDVGFIRLRDKKKYPHFRIDIKVSIGEDVVILGYPFGLNEGIAITQGIVSLDGRNQAYFGTKLVLHTDIASYPGNSGSPVIDMDGECVGILIGGMYGADNFSICTTGKILELALAKCIAFEAMENAR